MTNPQLKNGFTLIELMVVIVIIGVLAAIAIPAYNDYLIRSRVSELINVSSNAKTTVAMYRLLNNAMPNTSSQADVTSITSKYVSNISIGANGVITVTGNQTTLGSSAPIAIILTPTYASGAITWSCASTGATQYIPSTCK